MAGTTSTFCRLPTEIVPVPNIPTRNVPAGLATCTYTMIEREPACAAGLMRVIAPGSGVDTVESDLDRLADSHAADLADRHRRFQFECAQIDHVEQFGIDSDLFARFDRARGDLSVERRAHDGIVQRQIRRRQRRLRRIEVRAGDLILALRGIEGVFRNEAFFDD